jgi:uncharacterized protein (DUF169 family)
MDTAHDVWAAIHRTLPELPEPVAITFTDTAPAGLQRTANPAPSGCTYWRHAADGASFYTVAADHENCAIGAYTHGAELSAATKDRLGDTITTLVGMRYIRSDEVAAIPHREQPLRFVAYAPLSKAEDAPDVVLLHGNAKQVMLLAEAATACNAMGSLQGIGRPACAIVAATLSSGKVTTSLGCIGNRVYTGLPDDQFYVAIPGSVLPEIAETLASIVHANSELEQMHRAKCASA